MVLLQVIQSMTMFLHNYCGTLSTTYSGTAGSPFQGFCQGNGAARALWLMISAIFVICFCLKGLVSHNFAPMCRYTFSLAALFHVDDADLNVLNL